MQLFLAERHQSSDLDGVVAFLPDSAIDRLLERKRRKL